MFANNACGSHSVASGTAADNIVALKLMLVYGCEIEINGDDRSDPGISEKLGKLRDGHLGILRTELGQFAQPAATRPWPKSWLPSASLTPSSSASLS
jgi:FAD/FMN-containing dehydrogenase